MDFVESLSDAHVERACIRFDGMLREELADLTTLLRRNFGGLAEVPSTPRRTRRFEIAETIAMMTPTGTRGRRRNNSSESAIPAIRYPASEHPCNARRLDIWAAVAVSSDLRGP